MSQTYDEFAAAAIEMLADPDLSQVITLSVAGTGTGYNDDTGTVDPGSGPVDYVGSGMVFDYSERLLNGTTILQGDQRVIMAPNLAVVPQNGDILTLANGRKLQVIISKPLAPGGQVVLLDMQARDL
jgi:hypothetical protein